MSQETLTLHKISGHSGTVPPANDTQRGFTVWQLVDTTTCIGCTACEWLASSGTTAVLRRPLRPHPPDDAEDTRWNYWNLILFNEHEREDGTWQGLMRSLIACTAPSQLPRRLPPPTEPFVPIHQRRRGFPADQLQNSAAAIAASLRPFNIPNFNIATTEYSFFPLHGSRQPGGLTCLYNPARTGCLHAAPGRHEFLAENRAKQLRDHFFMTRRRFTIPRASANRRDLTVLHDANQAELYGGLPTIHYPMAVKFLEATR